MCPAHLKLPKATLLGGETLQYGSAQVKALTPPMKGWQDYSEAWSHLMIASIPQLLPDDDSSSLM